MACRFDRFLTLGCFSMVFLNKSRGGVFSCSFSPFAALFKRHLVDQDVGLIVLLGEDYLSHLFFPSPFIGAGPGSPSTLPRNDVFDHPIPASVPRFFLLDSFLGEE